jgi:hypothetical protein
MNLSELAGELRDVYPVCSGLCTFPPPLRVSQDKKLTIVHGDKLPLNNFYPQKFRATVRKNLEMRNIELVFEEYVDTIPSPGETAEAKTRSGKSIEADLVVSALSLNM